MRNKLTSLEGRFLGGAQPDLLSGALVASGVRSEKALQSYVEKVDLLHKRVRLDIRSDTPLVTGKVLFDWLWRTKPHRYRPWGNFRLTDVVDAQLDPIQQRVGNCLGLTLLYNILARSFGLDVSAVYLEEAFGRDSHVLSVLEYERRKVDVENIFPFGFDYREHVHDPQRVVWGDAELIADIFHSIAWALHERGELEQAIFNYSKAIFLNPRYGKAYLNRGIAYSMLGRDREARRDLAFRQD